MSVIRVGSMTPSTSKTELFVKVAKKWKLSEIATKCSILDVTVVLELKVVLNVFFKWTRKKRERNNCE